MHTAWLYIPDNNFHLNLFRLCDTLDIFYGFGTILFLLLHFYSVFLGTFHSIQKYNLLLTVYRRLNIGGRIIFVLLALRC